MREKWKPLSVPPVVLGEADWQSPTIPSSIRRPWQVFEKSVDEAAGEGWEACFELRRRLVSRRQEGAWFMFESVTARERDRYTAVALVELSAFVRWRTAELLSSVRDAVRSCTFKAFDVAAYRRVSAALWDAMGYEDKITWMAEDPLLVLADDPVWSAFLENDSAMYGRLFLQADVINDAVAGLRAARTDCNVSTQCAAEEAQPALTPGSSPAYLVEHVPPTFATATYDTSGVDEALRKLKPRRQKCRGSECGAGVSFDTRNQAWRLRWYPGGRETSKVFRVTSFVDLTGSYEAADDAARQAAITFRRDLVAKGVIKAKHEEPDRAAMVPDADRGAPRRAAVPAVASSSLAEEIGDVAGRRIVMMAKRQSGVPGVTWRSARNAWAISWYMVDKRKKKQKYFAVSAYMQPGMAPEEADALALAAATAFREAQVRSGKALVRRKVDRQSGTRGVVWMAGLKAWRVRLQHAGKIVFCKNFQCKDDSPREIEQARLAAIEKRKELEEKHLRIVVGSASSPNKHSRATSGPNKRRRATSTPNKRRRVTSGASKRSRAK